MELMTKNGPGGLALAVARYEACEGGMDQLYAGFGEKELEHWNQFYSATFGSKDK